MNTKQYVKKFFADGKYFGKHQKTEFINLFRSEMEGTINYYTSTTSNNKISKNIFDQVVKETRDKWDSIDNKCGGKLTEGFWSFFYATVVAEIKNDLFPEDKAFVDMVCESNNQDLMQIIEPHIHDYYLHNDISVNRILTCSFMHGIDREIESEIRDINSSLNHGNNKYKAMPWKSELCLKVLRGRLNARYNKFKIWEEQQAEHEKAQRRQEIFDYYKPASSFDLLDMSCSYNDIPTAEDVKKAYRKKAMSIHPDKGGSKDDFIALTEAKDKCIKFVSIDIDTIIKLRIDLTMAMQEMMSRVIWNDFAYHF